jgi:hypothetical protein
MASQGELRSTNYSRYRLAPATAATTAVPSSHAGLLFLECPARTEELQLSLNLTFTTATAWSMLLIEHYTTDTHHYHGKNGGGVGRTHQCCRSYFLAGG